MTLPLYYIEKVKHPLLLGVQKLSVDRHGTPHILTRKGTEEWTEILAKA
jgi:hypothetical protein